MITRSFGFKPFSVTIDVQGVIQLKEYKHGNITVTIKGTPDMEKIKEAVKKFAIAVEKERANKP